MRGRVGDNSEGADKGGGVHEGQYEAAGGEADNIARQRPPTVVILGSPESRVPRQKKAAAEAAAAFQVFRISKGTETGGV